MGDLNQKVAERLILINNRCVGILTRLYNIKKSCGTSQSRPKVLIEKNFDQAVSIVNKRFPIADLKKNSNAFSTIDDAKIDILKSLNPYYYTFVHLLELKEQVLQQLTLMDATQFSYDITLNFDATAAYLNMIVNFICAMILMSRIEDRKSLVGIYNIAHELANGTPESKFPRLAQMIIDYESPLKKLNEDLSPLHRSIVYALTSISEIYKRRNIPAEEQRNSGMISLTLAPKQMLYAAQTNTCTCEFLSLDLMDRWIIFCVTVCHNTMLNIEPVSDLFYRALRNGVCIRLFRDENILIFSMLQNYFKTIKGYNKKVQELEEIFGVAVQGSVSLHFHRRQFLKTALRDLCFLIKDQPGLLGPKILFIWIGLSCSKDEILWLLRHHQVWPTIMASKKPKEQSDIGINDKSLPELLFYMIELQNLVQKYAALISRYHAQYIQGYDSVFLKEQLTTLTGLNEREYMLINNAIDELSNIQDSACDLRGVRLDWFRFQTLVSMNTSQFKLSAHKEFTYMMNTTIFHSKMVDLIGDLIRETSDLSIYCFYFPQFDSQLKQTLSLPVQSRFAIAYAHICTHFTFALHDFCPEEHEDITEKSLSHCNAVLDRLGSRIADIINKMTADELTLEKKMSPEACAELVSMVNGTQRNVTEILPGAESHRPDRDVVTEADKNSVYLMDLCNAIGYSKEIHVCEHIFAPREYLNTHLSNEIINTLNGFIKTNTNDLPRRPSEMLMLLNAQIHVLQNLETCLRFDLTQFLTDALLQQTQLLDSQGKETITSIYSRWYLEVLLRKASIGQLIYSEHLREFIGTSELVLLPFLPEQYTDTKELRALVQLIGPYGVKVMAEKLVWHVARQINELYKLVNDSRAVLTKARVSFDKPEVMQELVSMLNVADVGKEKKQSKEHTGAATGSPIESVLQRVTIIGEIIAFRNMLYDALKDVIELKLPFLMNSLNGLFQSALPLGKVHISEMCAAAGIHADVDMTLLTAIQAQANRMKDAEEHYTLTCLLFVFIAISLPKLASSKLSFFNANMKASANNCHVIPTAVNAMANVLFFYHNHGDTSERMREFLALASSSLLQIIGTSEAEQMEMHQSVFIFLENLIKGSPFLHFGLLESCFPFTMIRSSYSKCYHTATETK